MPLSDLEDQADEMATALQLPAKHEMAWTPVTRDEIEAFVTGLKNG